MPTVDPNAQTVSPTQASALLRQAIDGPAPPGTAFIAPDPQDFVAVFPGLTVEKLLGQGGMGAVYLARQVRLDRQVALKILPLHLSQDPNWSARFEREARALARLNHPHLVTIHDVGCAGGWHYLVMEYVDGASLRQVLRQGRLSAAEALNLVPQLCDALQYAHDHGVVHRDLKPENILVDGRGRAKIADFGLAKLLLEGEQEPAPTLTASGVVMGTLHYMAPEQIEGAKHVDHRADIYSLGVVIYEMLTGGLPLGRFDAPSRRIAIDVRIDAVVMRSLEKEPERRWQRASDIQERFEKVAATSHGGTPGAPPNGPRLLPGLLLLGGVLLILPGLSLLAQGVSADRTLGFLGLTASPLAAWGGWCLARPRSRPVIITGLASWAFLLLVTTALLPGLGLLLIVITGICCWPLRNGRFFALLAMADETWHLPPRWLRSTLVALWLVTAFVWFIGIGHHRGPSAGPAPGAAQEPTAIPPVPPAP